MWKFSLTPSPTLAPTSVFSFFPILIVEENVCNTVRNKAVMVLIESLYQISKAIKDEWEVTSVARRCTPWLGTPSSWRVVGEPAHHTSFSAYAQSRGDQISIQRVQCLCSLFVALLLKKAQSKFYHPGIHGRPLARCRSPYQNLLRGYPHQQFWWGEVLPLPNIPKHSQITYGEGRPAKIGEESRRDSYSIGKECWAIFCGTDFFSFLSQFGLRVWT